MDHRHVVPVAANGRMNLPSALRARLELEGGGKVVFIEKENGEVEVTTLRRSLQRARDLVRHYIPDGAGIVEELIAERRADAAREEGRDGADSPAGRGRPARFSTRPRSSPFFWRNRAGTMWPCSWKPARSSRRSTCRNCSPSSSPRA